MTLGELRRIAEDRLAGLPEGPDLTPLDAALIDFGLAMAPYCLNRHRAEEAGRLARQYGATERHLHNVLVLVSGVGVHTLMTGCGLIDSVYGINDSGRIMKKDEKAAWDAAVGDNPYWITFERYCPGFLRSMLRQSHATFCHFFETGRQPWQARSLSAIQMELISIAIDAGPYHIFGPGFRLHLENAIKVGAGRRQILATLARADEAPRPAPVD